MSQRKRQQSSQDLASAAISRRRLLALGGLSAAGLASTWLAGCAPSQGQTGGGAASKPAASGGTAPQAGGGQPIRIAFHMPLTGPAALLGAQCRAGAQMAVDEINAAGGVNGRPIEVSVEDSGGDNTSAINTFNKIIGDRPVAVVGSMITPQVLAISNLVQRESIPYLFSATSTTVTRQGIPWFFRLGVHDELRNRAAIRYLVDRLGKQRIAALHTNDDYGKTAASVAADELKARYGKDLVADESFGGNDKDLSAQILSIQRANADGAMVNTFPTTMALALKQMKQLGTTFTVMGDNSVISPVMATLLTEAEMDGAYAASGGVPQASDDPKVKAWIATYQERNNGTEPDGYSLGNYDGVHLLAQALARAPSTEPQAVHDALMATKNYKGLLYPYTFDQYGDGVHLVVISRNKGKQVEVLDTVWEEGYSA